MKKLSRVLILLMINILMVVGNVYADMEGPRGYSAEAFVSNENGAALYNWKPEKKDVSKGNCT